MRSSGTSIAMSGSVGLGKTHQARFDAAGVFSLRRINPGDFECLWDVRRNRLRRSPLRFFEQRA